MRDMIAPPLPKPSSFPLAEHINALRPAIDLLLVTATEIERDAVLRRLRPIHGRDSILRGTLGPLTYYVGSLGPHGVALMMCRMGSVGSGASRVAVAEACATWALQAVVMAGVAFGADPARQGFGDVLVSSQIISYEEQRVGNRREYRGPIAEASRTLIDRFRNVLDWSFPRGDGTVCGHTIGPILSGEKLVANTHRKGELLDRFPDAIGGEMEGRGLYASAVDAKVDWILVKGICDWGDETKHNAAQPLAAAAAVDLIWAALSDAGALHGLTKTTGESTASARILRRIQRGRAGASGAVVAKKRGVTVGGDGRGSVIVTGDGNRLTVRGKR